jgi:hypothetical protein
MASKTSRLLSLFAASISLVTVGLVTPQPSRAYNSRVDVRLDRLTNETFDALMRRAEVVARAAAQRSFDRDVLISDVSVQILGQNAGTEMPLMALDVSRQNWQNRPDVRRWATYYKSARVLFGLPSQGDFAIPNPAGAGFTPVNTPQPMTAPAPGASPIPMPIDTPGIQSTPTPSPVVPSPGVEASPRSNAPKAEEAAKDASQKAGTAAKDGARPKKTIKPKSPVQPVAPATAPKT